MIYNIFLHCVNIFDSEFMHNLFINSIYYVPNNMLHIMFYNPYTNQDSKLTQFIHGNKYVHPIGLSAGFDKNAVIIDKLHHLGFSFVEFGSVTYDKCCGNNKPRIWLDIKNKSIINNCGLNNDGIKIINNRIKKYDGIYKLGGNISPYLANHNNIKNMFHMFNNNDKVSYITCNISCPNIGKNIGMIDSLKHVYNSVKKPIYIKISPELNNDDLKTFIMKSYKHCNGYIISNTIKIDCGGISGKPIKNQSTALLKKTYKILKDNNICDTHVLIASGGVMNGKDAYDKICNGASLVQIYTSFILYGPKVIKNICLDLDELLVKDGFKNVKNAIGKNV